MNAVDTRAWARFGDGRIGTGMRRAPTSCDPKKACTGCTASLTSGAGEILKWGLMAAAGVVAAAIVERKKQIERGNGTLGPLVPSR